MMERKLKVLAFCVIIAVSITMFTACSEKVLWAGNSYPGNMEATYKYFNSTESVKFNLKEGDTVAFTSDSKVDKGSLSIKIIDPDNKTIMEIQSNQAGTEKIKAEKDGKYKVVITGSKTSGSYDVKWKIEK